MEKSVEQLRKEFLDETVAFYSEDVSRRAVEDDNVTCRYRIDEKKCAIGRHIPDEIYHNSIEGGGIESLLVRECLPKEIIDLGISFLNHVQALHDNNFNWNEHGLSDSGELHYNAIIKIFC